MATELSNYKGKKVIVTGHTGFKGSWLCSWLKLLEANVYGISLDPPTDPNHISLLNLEQTSSIQDINNFSELSKIITKIDPDIVFHMAAQSLVRDSYDDPICTFQTNAIGTANTLSAVMGCSNVKAVVVITTDKCYENVESDYAYVESDPLGGYDPYSASKACAEIVTASYRQSFFNNDKFGIEHNTLVATVRAGNVIGGGDWAKDRLIPDIVRATVNSEKVVIRSPNAVRPWQHVLEPLHGYLLLGRELLNGKKQFATAFNFAPEKDSTITVEEILKLIYRIWPKMDYEIRVDKFKHEATLLMLDATKAKSMLGWEPIWDTKQTIEKTIDWYRKFYESNRIITIDQIQEYVQELL